jgi:DNA-binding NarL/FixJ family response regulator
MEVKIMPATLLLVDDHKLFREGLKSMLQADQRITIAGEAANGREALKLVRKLTPDLVIMDIAIPELNGIEVTRRISGDYPDTKIIVLSMHSSRRFVVDALKAGACGYLIKDCAMQELIMAMEAVREGKVYLSPSITGSLVKRMTRIYDTESLPPDDLSHREIEVLQLLTEGKSCKQTANQLNVSVKTIQTHRRNIMQKLDLHHITLLTKYAIQHGLISGKL